MATSLPFPGLIDTLSFLRVVKMIVRASEIIFYFVLKRMQVIHRLEVSGRGTVLCFSPVL